MKSPTKNPIVLTSLTAESVELISPALLFLVLAEIPVKNEYCLDFKFSAEELLSLNDVDSEISYKLSATDGSEVPSILKLVDDNTETTLND